MDALWSSGPSKKTPANSLTKGCEAEQQARSFLEQHGLTFTANNFRCKCGEIDLIMQDKSELVFVEVRLRKNNHFGSAADSVSQAKQGKLQRAAAFYLQQNNLTNSTACRFDVVAITGGQLEWLRGAF